MNYPINKLWGCITTDEAIRRLQEQPHFFANDDHILVIAKENPGGMTEMTEEYIRLFRDDDWDWLRREQDAILWEEENTYYNDFQKYQKDLMERFEKELEETARKGRRKPWLKKLRQ